MGFSWTGRIKQKNKWRKRLPLQQGVLQRIKELFIDPLLKFKDDEMPVREFLHDQVFHLNTRSIIQMKARVDFKMSGALRVLPSRSIPGYGQRKVKAGTTMWVRQDKTSKIVEIEIHNGNGGAEQIFALTEWDWRKVKACLI